MAILVSWHHTITSIQSMDKEQALSPPKKFLQLVRSERRTLVTRSFWVPHEEMDVIGGGRSVPEMIRWPRLTQGLCVAITFPSLWPQTAPVSSGLCFSDSVAFPESPNGRWYWDPNDINLGGDDFWHSAWMRVNFSGFPYFFQPNEENVKTRRIQISF